MSDEIKDTNENPNSRLDHISAAECRCRMSDTTGATWLEALLPAAKAYETKSYEDILIARSTSSILHPANPNNPEGRRMTSAKNVVHQGGHRTDGLTTVVKKTRNKPGNIHNIPNSGIHKSRSAMVGVGNPPASL